MNSRHERLKEAAELLPTFAANYVKRFLEKAYDGLFQTKVGAWLASLSSGKKHGVEFALYALTAFFERRLAENTKLAKFAKEVGIDAAPEISKRMINGMKEEILTGAKSPAEKELADLLLSLEDRELTELIRWLYEKKASEKRSLIDQLSLLSSEQISRLLNLSAEERERFFEILNSKEEPANKTGLLSGETREEIQELTAKIREARLRFREKWLKGGKEKGQ